VKRIIAMARSPACGEVVTARGALRQERRLLETSTGPGRPDHRGVSRCWVLRDRSWRSSRRPLPSRTLKTAQQPISNSPTGSLEVRSNMVITVPEGLAPVRCDHRQDSKGTRWMPWHLEPKKGVNDCEKPRVGVE
jgi:hypothetical protein